MFIVFEGIDGSGKSTQAKMLADYLTNQGYEVVLTREPGGTPFAEGCRSLLIEHDLSARAALSLIQAARIDHLQKVIVPALNHGKVVICDRFVWSSVVYQGCSFSDVDLSYMFHAISRRIDILLDTGIDTCLARFRNRVGNRLDGDRKRLKDLRDRYRATIHDQSIVVTGGIKPEMVFVDIVEELKWIGAL